MEMEIARLANVSWLQTADRQVIALQTDWAFANTSEDRPDIACDNEPRPLPTLDWPSDLFADNIVCQ